MIDTATYPMVCLARRVPRAVGAGRARLIALSILSLRLYVGVVWLRFGIAKLTNGWLTSNPLRPLLTTIAAHQLPTTAPGYSFVAHTLVAIHADAFLSVAIPVTEILIALALLTGRSVRLMALVACALNANLLLAGVASVALDVRMIVLQLVLIALVTFAKR